MSILKAQVQKAEAEAADAARRAAADTVLRSKLEAKLAAAEQQAGVLAQRELGAQQELEALNKAASAAAATLAAAQGGVKGAEAPGVRRLQADLDAADAAAQLAVAAAEAAAAACEACRKRSEALDTEQAQAASALAAAEEAARQARSRADEARGRLPGAEAAVQAAEAAWCDARTRQGTLQGQLDEARARCALLASSAASRAEGRGAGGVRWSSHDAVVAELAQSSAAGKLPGTFFGRLCNVAWLSKEADAAAGLAVNAVLQEVGCSCMELR